MLKFERLEERQLLAADMFEPNNSGSQASDLGFLEQFHMGLTLDSPSDEDWYQWRPLNRGDAKAELLFRHADGNIDLHVYDVTGSLLGSSTSTTDNESVIWPADPGQNYFVRVFGVRGATQEDYDLYLDMPGLWIGWDAFEGELRNNTFASATDLAAGEQIHKSLTLDIDQIEGVVDRDDFYQWTAREVGTLTVDVFFRHDLGDIDLRLYDANQQLLTQSASNTDDEQVTWQVEVGQTVFIHVLGDASPGYDLEIGFQPGGANEPPMISITPVTTTEEDEVTDLIVVRVSDAETPANSLLVTAASDNQTLVSDASIDMTGRGPIRFFEIVPEADQAGEATITVMVQDGDGAVASASFLLEVEAVNDAPRNTVPEMQTMPRDATLVFSADNGNLISTSDVDAGSQGMEAHLQVDGGTLTLSNTETLNSAEGNGTNGITMSGSIEAINAALNGLAYRPLPGFAGVVTLELRTNDLGNSGSGGPLVDSDAVVIKVGELNDPPTISQIPDQRITEGTPIGPLRFTLRDDKTPTRDLVLNVTSDNPGLIPQRNLLIERSAEEQFLLVTPEPHKLGRATISLMVDDGQGGRTEESFVVTVSSLPDTDGDGLPDLWETEGLDFNGDGTIDLDLPGELGADPNRMDLYVEVDAMAGRGPHPRATPHPDVPEDLATGTVLDDVIAAFLDAPVQNPDGTSGIRLHIQLDETSIPLQQFGTGWEEYDALRCGADLLCDPNDPQLPGSPNGHFGTAEQRAHANGANIVAAKFFVYRYGLFADRRGEGGLSGLAELPGNDFLVTLGDWTTPEGNPGGTAEQQAGTFMHELGHTLGLDHGGGDHVLYKPNYFSVMNFHWQLPTQNTGWGLDFSRDELPPLDESNLLESAGLGFPVGSIHDSEEHLVHVGPAFMQRVPLVGPADYNGDGDTSDSGLTVDLNNDGTIGQLAGHNDWENLQFAFRDLGNSGDGVHTCSELDEDCDQPEVQPDYPLYGINEDDFEPNDIPEDISELADLLEDDRVVDASIHDPDNEDWFRWKATIQGILEVVLQRKQDAHLELTLGHHDSEGTPLITESDTDTVRVEPEIRAGETYLFKVTATETGYYILDVDGPEVWDGDAAEGTPGDGTQWGDKNNWTVDGSTDDRVPDQSDHVTFDVNSVGRNLQLGGGSQSVRSLTFLGDYELWDGVLDVVSGIVSVVPGAMATFQANLAIPSGILKTNEGTLVVNGQVDGFTEVSSGTLGGTAALGSLLVQADGTVSPGNSVGTMSVDGPLALIGTMIVELNASGADAIDASGPVTLAGATLNVTALEHLDVGNEVFGETSRTILTGSTITGTFATAPPSGQHVGHGVFMRNFNGTQQPLRVNSQNNRQSLEIALLQAAAGDANGDRQFDQFDIIQILDATKYLSGQTASWLEGDWDGNGRFDQFDLIQALQNPIYLQGPYAAQRMANDAEKGD